MMATGDHITRAIELTPTGRGAVAVVLVAGPGAVRAVDAGFHPAGGKPIADSPLDRIVFGRWGSPAGEEVVVCRRAADVVEVHCHGGVAAVRGVIDRLAECGCQSTQWQDWTRESNGEPIQAEAQIALADAPTARAAAILLDQFEGALSESISRVLEAAVSGDWKRSADVLDRLLGRCDLGLHLTTPWQVVIAGRPNVGKSSLLNALVGFQRAIVCDEPGTTRDVVTASTAIDGWPVQLADTAGLRETHDVIESEGVVRATAAAKMADLVLFVEDAPDGFENVPADGRRVIRVLNKVDLLPDSGRARFDSFDFAVSALTGQGIAELVSAIGHALVPAPPTAGDALPFTADQVERLAAARQAVEERDRAAIASSLASFLRR